MFLKSYIFKLLIHYGEDLAEKKSVQGFFYQLLFHILSNNKISVIN